MQNQESRVLNIGLKKLSMTAMESLALFTSKLPTSYQHRRIVNHHKSHCRIIKLY